MGSKSIKIIDSETKQQLYKDAFTFTSNKNFLSQLLIPLCLGTISALAVTPDNKFIIVGLQNGSVHVCNFENQNVHHKFEYLHNRISKSHLAILNFLLYRLCYSACSGARQPLCYCRVIRVLYHTRYYREKRSSHIFRYSYRRDFLNIFIDFFEKQ